MILQFAFEPIELGLEIPLVRPLGDDEGFSDRRERFRRLVVAHVRLGQQCQKVRLEHHRASRIPGRDSFTQLGDPLGRLSLMGPRPSAQHVRPRQPGFKFELGRERYRGLCLPIGLLNVPTLGRS